MRRKLRVFGVCAVSVLLVQALLSAQAPPASKPTPEHQKLAYFVGTWSSEGEMKPGPMGPGGKMSSTDTCEWFEGGFSVICRGQGTTPMGPSKSVGIIGYSTEEKAYTYYGVDNTPMIMTSVPKGTIQGDTWTFTDESSMGGKKVKTRVTLKELSPTSYTFTMQFQGDDGTWTTMMESKQTKKG